MCKFSEDSKQKLGNAIVFITNRVEQLSKTKLLKLLYLMEEYMVKIHLKRIHKNRNQREWDIYNSGCYVL